MGSEGPMAATTQKESVGQLQLPRGFRFHPTDEELVLHYLCPKAESQPFSIQIIADVDIYKFDPWNLPEKAVHGESEWYFFSPRDRKYPNGSRPNRAAGSGYWKATGTDKHITCAVEGADGPCQVKKLGVKKALVFYKGRAPNGTKTNWIMHEYRLADGATCNSSSAPTSRRVHRKGSLRLDDWVLCRIYKKKSSSSSSSMVASDSKQEEEKAESFREESGVDSIIVEEFLASLPEIETSKLGQLHLLPKLEGHNELSPHMKHYQQSASTGSGVMDHRPADLFEHGYQVDLRRE